MSRPKTLTLWIQVPFEKVFGVGLGCPSTFCGGTCIPRVSVLHVRFVLRKRISGGFPFPSFPTSENTETRLRRSAEEFFDIEDFQAETEDDAVYHGPKNLSRTPR